MATRVVLLGCGTVGRSVLELLLASKHLQSSTLAVVAIADSTHLMVTADGRDGELDAAVLGRVAAAKAAGERLSSLAGPALAVHDVQSGLAGLLKRLGSAPAPGPLHVFADCTATGDPALHLEALSLGACLVLANKKPVSGHQADYDRLTQSPDRIRMESTVGAGLPVHATLRRLLAAGDAVGRVAGAFSGTLGYVMTGLQQGQPFSAVVAEAKAQGYTEPDPRDDLSGVDVARKALILARSLGLRAELSDLAVEPLFPPEFVRLSVDEFMARLPELDERMAGRVQAAAGRGGALRYAAVVEPGAVRVGLQEVAADSALGRLRGTANLVEFTTAAFPDGLVICGPGAGAAVTAAGVLADIIELHTIHNGRWRWQ